MKSSTDNHWNQRAASVSDDKEVNIMDVFQRELEYDHISRYLKKTDHLLEVGCGNGFSTSRLREMVSHIDAFDYAENMIERAKSAYKETNNHFYHDNVLNLEKIDGAYDVVLCVRVLINLRNLEEQKKAIQNLIPLVKPQGLFLLIEGYTEGFYSLSKLRESLEMPPVSPAKINFYSSVDDILPEFSDSCILKEKFHLGMYDFLTRVVYPQIVGAENAISNTVFSEKCHFIARQYDNNEMEGFSRIRGFVFQKK